MTRAQVVNHCVRFRDSDELGVDGVDTSGVRAAKAAPQLAARALCLDVATGQCTCVCCNAADAIAANLTLHQLLARLALEGQMKDLHAKDIHSVAQLLSQRGKVRETQQEWSITLADTCPPSSHSERSAVTPSWPCQATGPLPQG